MLGGARPGAGRKKGAPNKGRGGNHPKKYLIRTKSYIQYIKDFIKISRKNRKKIDIVYKLFLKK